MALATVTGYDVTAENYNQRPSTGIPALYITGSGGIPATAAMLSANPKCLRIDQSPVINSIDTTADYFDVENGAVTVAEIGNVIKEAITNYQHATRPGQRWPAVYCSRDDPQTGVTPVVNALNAAGLSNHSVGLIIADWNNDEAQATSEVANSIPGTNNPYPVVGRQYRNAGPYDLNVFSEEWVNTVSEPTQPTNTNVTVPNVVGKTAGDAHNLIMEAGLIPTAPKGQRATEIVSVTNPKSGATVGKGSSVEIITQGETHAIVVDDNLNVYQVTTFDYKTWTVD